MTQHSKISSVRCNQSTDDRAGESFHIGSVDTPIGKIPRVGTELQFADRLGTWKARWSFGRRNYRVEPGLYAVGNPTEISQVFVTANYKMSFDRLRAELAGLDGWILVLDTKGINVWCAAGKGTFGTDEIVRRIQAVGLEQIVSHRRLILPQLGAPGVAAHEVRDRSGFRVRYGPIRAQDLAAFMQAGMKATPQMRRVRFDLRDRLVLVPTDLILSAKYAILAAACFLLLSGLGPGVYSLDNIARYGIVSAALICLAYVIGTALPPVLLPLLPGRSFSVKGAWGGLILSAAVLWYATNYPHAFRNLWAVSAWLIIMPAVSSFITMNFTGSSTYTSLSGVVKEMRIALPIQITAAFIGVGLWTIGLFA